MFFINEDFPLMEKILFAISLPDCLKPMFIVGILADGASIIPAEEFPITQSKLLSIHKNYLDLMILSILNFIFFYETLSLFNYKF